MRKNRKFQVGPGGPIVDLNQRRKSTAVNAQEFNKKVSLGKIGKELEIVFLSLCLQFSKYGSIRTMKSILISEENVPFQMIECVLLQFVSFQGLIFLIIWFDSLSMTLGFLSCAYTNRKSLLPRNISVIIESNWSRKNIILICEYLSGMWLKICFFFFLSEIESWSYFSPFRCPFFRTLQFFPSCLKISVCTLIFLSIFVFIPLQNTSCIFFHLVFLIFSFYSMIFFNFFHLWFVCNFSESISSFLPILPWLIMHISSNFLHAFPYVIFPNSFGICAPLFFEILFAIFRVLTFENVLSVLFTYSSVLEFSPCPFYFIFREFLLQNNVLRL